MSATSTTEEFAAVAPQEDDRPTVQIAWQAYELTERELWEVYAADRSYLAGKVYLAGEQLAWRRCERAVQRARFQRR